MDAFQAVWCDALSSPSRTVCVGRQSWLSTRQQWHLFLPATADLFLENRYGDLRYTRLCRARTCTHLQMSSISCPKRNLPASISAQSRLLFLFLTSTVDIHTQCSAHDLYPQLICVCEASVALRGSGVVKPGLGVSHRVFGRLHPPVYILVIVAGVPSAFRLSEKWIWQPGQNLKVRKGVDTVLESAESASMSRGLPTICSSKLLSGMNRFLKTVRHIIEALKRTCQLVWCTPYLPNPL